jgi:hypothetical protein
MNTELDKKHAEQLISALSDKRTSSRGIAEYISIQPLISQEIVFDFVREYIKYYAFLQDTGGFPNGNMHIAAEMSNIRYALDDYNNL